MSPCADVVVVIAISLFPEVPGSIPERGKKRRFVHLLSFFRRSDPFRGITSPWRAILGWAKATFLWFRARGSKRRLRAFLFYAPCACVTDWRVLRSDTCARAYLLKTSNVFKHFKLKFELFKLKFKLFQLKFKLIVFKRDLFLAQKA